MNKNIEFLIVSNEDSLKIIKFQNEFKYSFPLFIINKKELESSDLNPTDYPTTYIITPDKKIALKETNAVNWYNKNVINFIEKIIKENK